MDVLDEVASAGPGRHRRRWPWILGVVAFLVAAALTWATFVGWDTTATGTFDPSWCPITIRVDGVELVRPPVPEANGMYSYSSFPSRVVRIHHQLLRHNRYTVIAADGSRIPATASRFGGVGCIGS